MFCKNCGNKIGERDKFCAKCGYGIESDGKVRETLSENRYNKTNKSEYTASRRANNNNGKRRNETSASKPGNKGLKTAFWVLMGISALLTVGIFVVMITGMNSSVDIGNILNAGPKVGNEVFGDWDKGEYSINNIHNADSSSLGTYGFEGVWELKGYKNSADDSEFVQTVNDESVATFLVIDVNESVHYITAGYDNSVLSYEKVAYSSEGESLVVTSAEGLEEGWIIEYKLLEDALGECVMLDGAEMSQWAIYEITDRNAGEMIGLAAAIQETETISEAAGDAVQKAPDYALESDLSGAWEKTVGNEYMGLEFYENGTLRYVEVSSKNEPFDGIIAFEVISETEISLGNDPDNIISVKLDYDAQFNETYLILGAEDDFVELYMVSALNPPFSE